MSLVELDSFLKKVTQKISALNQAKQGIETRIPDIAKNAFIHLNNKLNNIGWFETKDNIKTIINGKITPPGLKNEKPVLVINLPLTNPPQMFICYIDLNDEFNLLLRYGVVPENWQSQPEVKEKESKEVELLSRPIVGEPNILIASVIKNLEEVFMTELKRVYKLE